MNLTARDRKIVLIILPLLALVAYWFLLLAPKREEANTAAKQLAKQEQRRDKARAAAKAAEGAQTDFAADYAEIVRLGKAIPAGVDMPSLIVQLDSAAEGTGIRFTKIALGQRDATTAAAPASTEPGASGGGEPVDAGGAPAQSAPGSAVESANETAQDAGQRSDAATQSGVDAQVSTSTGSGLPIGGGAAAPTAGAAGSAGPAGLETVPLDLEFVGNFFNLAGFFHDVKRFVQVANQQVVVNGRLITVEGVNFSSDPELFPRITAEVTATVYLAPKAEGTTAGATPQGPAPAAPGSEVTPASDDTPSPTPAPTATATP